jgi:hypothetical protein
LHSEELHNLYYTPIIIRAIETRRIRCAGHVARVGEMRDLYKIPVGKREERESLGDLGLDERIRLKWFFSI